MRAKATPYSAPLNGEDVARENSKALLELAASKFLVEAHNDDVPTERLEEGMPILRRNETMAASFLPHGDDSSGQAGRPCA